MGLSIETCVLFEMARDVMVRRSICKREQHSSGGTVFISFIKCVLVSRDACLPADSSQMIRHNGGRTAVFISIYRILLLTFHWITVPLKSVPVLVVILIPSHIQLPHPREIELYFWKENFQFATTINREHRIGGITKTR